VEVKGNRKGIGHHMKVYPREPKKKPRKRIPDGEKLKREPWQPWNHCGSANQEKSVKEKIDGPGGRTKKGGRACEQRLYNTFEGRDTTGEKSKSRSGKDVFHARQRRTTINVQVGKRKTYRKKKGKRGSRGEEEGVSLAYLR